MSLSVSSTVLLGELLHLANLLLPREVSLLVFKDAIGSRFLLKNQI